ncbi:MAG TPA: HAMP domain-containing sensor histidine kinase [Bacteroidales bacterium]|nr:HAMP domain-containing sensor histidine kinase [Bacteroidales bacterium]
MPYFIIVTFSIIMQLAAAIIALLSIQYTSRKTGWIFIAVAMVIMTIRRIETLVIILDSSKEFINGLQEITAFIISLLLLTGSYSIQKYFRSISQARDELVRNKEELMKSEQQLKSADYHKNRFFSIIAHDLRNPFNSILGFSTLIMQNIEKYPREKLKEMVKHIHNSSQQAYSLTENLLLWSRSQTGKLELEPMHQDITKTIASSIRLFSEEAKRRGIRLYSEITSPKEVFYDENTVFTILRNLISNALKFTPEGEIRISDSITDNQIEISVIDTGIGIKKHYLEKIFDLDKDYTTPGLNNEKGTGLGLNLCYEFAQLNNGNIRVESKEGKGTKFTFSLPLKPANHNA